MTNSPTPDTARTEAPAQLDDRDLDQVAGGLIIVVSPQTAGSPRDPGTLAGGPKLGLPLI